MNVFLRVVFLFRASRASRLADFSRRKRFGHQFIGENELGFAHVLDRKQDFGLFAFGRVVAPDAHRFALGSGKHAAKTLAAFERHSGFDLGEMAGIALEIGFAHQRPIDSGRGNLQPIGSVDWIGDIEYRRQRARHDLAVFDRHRAIRALRHDLHGAAFGARYAHAHQPVTELFNDWLHDRGDARGKPRLGDEPRFIRCGAGRRSSATCRSSVIR